MVRLSRIQTAPEVIGAVGEETGGTIAAGNIIGIDAGIQNAVMITVAHIVGVGTTGTTIVGKETLEGQCQIVS